MNSFERLEEEAYSNNVDVVNYDFDSSRIRGLYCDGVIGLNRNIETITEKACVLAEELGHHYTTVGDIMEQDAAANRKQELQARMWAYNKQIGLMGLVKAYEHGCRSAHDAAEYLDVTEEFFLDAVKSYSSKYGECAAVDNYIVYFAPSLCVLKLL